MVILGCSVVLMHLTHGYLTSYYQRTCSCPTQSFESERVLVLIPGIIRLLIPFGTRITPMVALTFPSHTPSAIMGCAAVLCCLIR